MALTLADELRLEGKREGKAEGKAEGKVEGGVEGVIIVLKARFGDLPAALIKRIQILRDPVRIGIALELAATCASLADFKKACK